MRCLVITLDESRDGAMPTGEALPVCPALACAIGAVDFIRGREDEKRVAVNMKVRILFQLLFSFYNRGLPAP